MIEIPSTGLIEIPTSVIGPPHASAIGAARASRAARG
jgi:hypothetical protein